ncbi:MAG: GIY-YIG nuclease family protein [Candidatus Saccharimonas sp.]
MSSYFVYILASSRNGTLYIGVTNNLERRIYEHRNHLLTGFSDKYNVTMLVYYEETGSIDTAIAREKRLKKYNRQWKINLIEAENPSWRDLADDLGLDSATSAE